MGTAIRYFAVMIFFVFMVACKKDWLNEKSNISIATPNTTKDLQALLDNTDEIFCINQPGLGEVSSDDYWVSYPLWESQANSIERNAYIWANDIYEKQRELGDWSFSYNQILTSNIILESLAQMDENLQNSEEGKNIKGSALFFRAFSLFNAASLFSKIYRKNSAQNDLGVPLRLDANVNNKTSRATVKDTYERIISDLIESSKLLPNNSKYKSRPSKPASFALLSRVLLYMNEYERSLEYADSCLKLNNVLMDYNSDPNIDAFGVFGVAQFNPEVLLHSTIIQYRILDMTLAYPVVDSVLYDSYADKDLRKVVFFIDLMGTGDLSFKASYGGLLAKFGGLATDEVYLNRAECRARLGFKESALEDLNHLLSKRFTAGYFSPIVASSPNEALDAILLERRKELCFRGLRWLDLKRLNQESARAKVLSRNLNGQQYNLLPNDSRYVLPIPDEVIRLSGIDQNPR